MRKDDNPFYIGDTYIHASRTTLKDLEDWLEELQSIPRKPYAMELPCSDYPCMSDEEFKAFLTSDEVQSERIVFIGGSVGYNRMKERMDKLGIR